MKKPTLLMVGLCLIWFRAFAQDSSSDAAAPIHVTAAEAKNHVNTNAVVTGKIAEVHRAGTIVHLNLEKGYPNQEFTAVIFANKTNLFPQIDSLKDKTVEVSGKITEYNHRPQIVITTTNQLKVVEKPQKKAE